MHNAKFEALKGNQELIEYVLNKVLTDLLSERSPTPRLAARPSGSGTRRRQDSSESSDVEDESGGESTSDSNREDCAIANVVHACCHACYFKFRVRLEG